MATTEKETTSLIGSDKVQGTTVFGLGEDYYPLPWSQLKYNPNLGGYLTNLTEAELTGAPKYRRSQEWDWSDRSNDRRVDDYYKTYV
jgi:hypothetical protein